MQSNQTSIPTAVLRKWKAAFEPEVPKEPKPTLKDVNVNLQQENHQLKVHIAELEAARSSDASADDPLGVVPLLRALKDTPKGERIKTIKWLMHEIELEVKDLR